ncbi:putative baseplate assembly protein [Calothrix sp. NIES-2098]|uniref:putative baseplate assembly protein n=1 Tax=Calothrix sp. NIES-2098 TaxID=1954171 RepID=UPI000B618D1B|nr:hypothetical protein NIES2098_16970 [Calothrix sp. NIES-2098]
MSDAKDFPKQLYNRPGLPSILYRIGDYTSFRKYLLSLLSQEINGSRPLAKLTTRASDDPAIALLDAWAMVGDVLTFYQERIANEGYLRTATERLSVLELARAIGYELNPGVAASTYLAFIVDDSPGSPLVATVPKGTVIQSIPGEGEKSQTFETESTIIARVDWNTLQPRASKPQEITDTTQQIYLQGTNTKLAAGDRILLIDEQGQNSDRYLLTLKDVVSVPEAGSTLVTWEDSIQIAAPLRSPKVFAFRKQAALFGNNAPRWDSLPNEIKRANGGTIRGGVFRLDEQSSSWIARSGDIADPKSLLPTIDIRCLAVNQRGYLFAGTTGSGIFRSLDNGQTWSAVNTGLTNQNIQCLWVDELGCVFAGTANGGVFQSKDEGENWNPIGTGSVRVEPKDNNQVEAVNTGLPNTVIRSLLAYTPEPLTQLPGTISSNITTVSGTNFTAALKPGDIIAAAGQTRIVDSITSDTALTINTRFRNTLPPGTAYFKGGTYIFAGTDDGIYLSVDQGKNWELKGLLNRSVRSLLIVHTTSAGTGTITSSSTTVTGVGTKFNTELRIGDAIAASNQVRIIKAITNDSQLTIDKAFDPQITTAASFLIIPASKTYIFAGTDNGIFRSSDYGNNWTEFSQRGLQNQDVTALAAGVWTGTGTIAIDGTTLIGVATNFSTELQVGDTITVPNLNRTVTNVVSDTQLTINSPFSLDIPAGTSFVIIHQGKGTISSNSNTINGNDTEFSTKLRIGDAITAADQTRIITSIANDTSATIDNGFKPDIPANTSFVVTRKGRGAIASNGTNISGIDTNFTTIGVGDRIVICENRTVTAINSNNEVKINAAINPPVPAGTLFWVTRQNSNTIVSDSTNITGNGANFNTQLRIGDTITAAGQTRIITSISDDHTSATIDTAFSPNIPENTSFVVTRKGTGTIGNLAVLGTGTKFNTELKVGSLINAAGQSKIVTAISSDTNLTVDDAFYSNLVAGTPFTITSNTSIFAGTAGNGVSVSTDNGNSWKPINQDLTNQDITALTTYIDSHTNTTNLITGTTGGIFLLAINPNNSNQRWMQISQGFSQSHVTSLAAYISRTGTISSKETKVTGIATSFTKELKKGDIIAAAGQTKTINEINSDTVLIVDDAFIPELDNGTSFISKNLFAGTLFAGFVENEWPNFQISDREIDLDTLYPTILADSWIVLVNDNHFQASLVESTANISRRDFLLDTKLTRVLLSNPINNIFDFELRKTLVLSQSEPLALAEERLTVTVQQNKILQEPIYNNEIYLNQFITGLQAQQTLLVSGKRIRAQINVGGFFHSLNWEPRNQGLGKQEVKTLLTDGNGNLFASTKNGVFRSSDRGKNWQIIPELQNQEVTSLSIYTREGGTLSVREQDTKVTFFPLSALEQELQVGINITVVEAETEFTQTRKIVTVLDTSNPNQPIFNIDIPFSKNLKIKTPFKITTLFAGTKTGVWQSIDDGQTWKPLVDNIKNIQALAINRDRGILFAGTEDRGIYEYIINQRKWRQIGLNQENIQALVINYSNNHLFAGTANNGIYRSTDNGANWRHFTVTKQGTGTISSSKTTVTGLGTLFNQELRPGDIIIAANQTSKIHAINSDNSCIIETAFSPELPTGTNFIVNTGLTNINITALLIDQNDILAGTDGSGVFRSTDNGEHWQPFNTNLSDLNIRSLAANTSVRLLFVGTEKRGVFRYLEQDKFWLPVNTGLLEQPVWSLVIREESKELFAGTSKGVFHSTDNGKNWQQTQWERSNQGLSLPQIQALTFAKTSDCIYLFAGNSDGVFRSIDNGAYWEPVNEGLTNKIVQVLTVMSGSNLLFAGTSEGMFRSEDFGQNWQKINTGLTHGNVQALASLNQKLFAATGNGGIFVTTNSGDRWNFSGLLDIDVKALAVNSENQYIFAGTTSNGIFRSINGGNGWEQLLLEKPGTSAISSKGTNVTGVGTLFTTELKVGGKITAAEQIRIITAITNDTTLTVNNAFRPDLPLGTTFTVNTGLTSKNITALLTYTQPLSGTISIINETTVIGVGTKFTQELRIGEAIASHKQSKIVTSITSDTELTVDTTWNDLPAESAFSKTYLFAGTAGSGIFRSQNNGETWELASGEETALLEIRCLEVNPENLDIFAGTARGGVFRSTDGGKTWEAVPVGLASTDVRAIAITQSNIMVGGVGILLSDDGFTVAEVKPNDLLWVVAPPVPLPAAGENAQRWQLQDRNGFIGLATTTNPQDIALQPATKEDPTFSEVAIIQIPPIDQKLPILKLTQPLKGSYDPETVRIYGNVVRATHGETVANEVLGSGDGTTDNQSFALKKPPLTYTPAPTATGNESTLQVYVNDVRWQEVPSLYSLDDKSQSYIVRIEDDGTTTVIFGDSKNGARLPSGQENITATYRSGIGAAGNVSTESLSLLKTRPLGIKEVTNPLPATGGVDQETLETARSKAPATVRTLDRIVSLRDFEDFAATFAGIGKAKAVALWNGNSQIVHITVAGSNGDAIATTSSLYEALLQAIDGARDPLQQVQVDSYEQLLFNLEATIQFDGRYKAEKLETEIRQALSEKFAFANRSFGQGVNASEAIAFIQNITGVVAVDLDALYRQQFSKTLADSIPALLARFDVTTNQIKPAQLLLLNPKGMTLKLEAIS